MTSDETRTHHQTAPALSLDELLAEYIAGEECGRPLDRQALIARHPSWAADLREFFANRDQMRRLAEPLRAPGTGRDGEDRPNTIRYFGDYELLEEIAAGGMGIVYRARQRSLNRMVAVKMILKGTLAGDEDVKRFRAEAEAAASLQHPAIVAIHEIGLHEGQHYFSMDFVDGRNLADVIREQPLTARQAAEYIHAAADAVHYAHQQGTLHRDLKPSNILIDRQGRLRITDFGLAKRLEGDSNLTLTGQILGTPSYMPPEQATGRRTQVGAACDVYSLGAVLYELLTGRPPFRGESPAETIRQVESLEPVSARLLNPSTPRDLETICFKCLEKEPRKRYASAQLLADDLGRYLRGDPILAKPVTHLERLVRWCRKRPAVAGLAAAVAFLMAVVIPGLVIWHTQRLGAQLQRTQVAELDTQDRLATSYLRLACASRLSKNVGQRYDSLEAVHDAMQILNQLPLSADDRQRRLTQLRTEAIAALALSDLKMVQESEVRAGLLVYGADPKFEHVACIELEGSSREGGYGSISVRRMADTAEIAKFPGRYVWAAVFGPDGKLVASPDIFAGRLNVWRLGDAAPVLVAPWALSPFEFSPGGQWLAVGTAQGVDLYDPQTGNLAKQIKTPGAPVKLAFHPGEGRLAATCGSRLVVLDLDNGALVEGLPHIASTFDVAWDRQGRRLAVQQADGSLNVWDLHSRRHVATMSGDDSGGVQLEFDATGNLLASSGWRRELRIWNAATGDLLLRTQNECVNAKFHRESSRIAPIRRGSRIGIAEIAQSEVFRTFMHAPVSEFVKYTRMAVSPDGRLLAMQHTTGVTIWELATGRELGWLAIGSATPQFEPSGDLLTMTSQAALRWPITRQSDSPGTWQVGPPQKLLGYSTSRYRAALSANGRVLAVTLDTCVLAAQLGPTEKSHLLPHEDVRYVDVSPDGRWVATGSHTGGTVKIWDADSGQLAHTIDTTGTHSDVGFSPDGRWLTTSGGGHRLWRVGAWQAVHDFGPSSGVSARMAGAFGTLSDARQILAIDQTDSTIRLVDAESGREHACLTNPTQSLAASFLLTPDGRRLIVANNETHAVEVWDIAKLRAALSQLGLDWDAPPYPPVAEFEPIRELLVVGDLIEIGREHAAAELSLATERLARDPDDAEAHFRRGHAYLQSGQPELAWNDLNRAIDLGYSTLDTSPFAAWLSEPWRRSRLQLDVRLERLKQKPNDVEDLVWSGYDAASILDYELALTQIKSTLARDPANTTALNLMARVYLFGPARLRDPGRGLEHAERCFQADRSRFHATTLAAALIRSGRGSEARRLLSERVEAADQIHCLFLLAILHHQDGNLTQSRALYDRGCRQLAAFAGQPKLLELSEAHRLRVEVEQLLRAE